MSTKKSNKTSHVLNLITNRTGMSTEELGNGDPSEHFYEGDGPGASDQPNQGPAIGASIQDKIEKAVSEKVEEAISEKIADAVSEQIRVNLEKVEIKEAEIKAKEAAKRQAALQAAFPSLERITAEQAKEEAMKPIAELPQVETYAPEKFEGEDEAAEETEIAEDEFIPIDEPPAPSTPAPDPSDLKPTLSDLKPVPSSMDGLVLVNILEEVIRLMAPTVMEDLGMCSCERCQSDVLAIALNSMEPKYVVTQKGALFAKVSSYGIQYKTDLVTVITKACMLVKGRPSHS